MSVAQTGNAWSIYGIGLMLGSLAASPMIAHLPTGLMFVFGPALSCAAVALIVGYAAPGAIWPVWLGFFALGFGPMTWLVLQTSVRQIVTPNALMGRVGATLSTAIYGVRPLGALAAGAVASHYGTQAALWLSAGLFFLSCGVLLTSPAARMRQMPVAG